jgi:HCOMODA/2-hydroxy-3-carboxy-muconic semialdehyde decarboxylase
MEFHLDGRCATDDRRQPYNERYIHGAAYEARPDMRAIVHSHAEAVLPFTIGDLQLRPVIHVAAAMGSVVPVWDIADEFGDDTDLMVTDIEKGRDMARRLGQASVVLLRGHGFTAGARSLVELVKLAVYIPQNARVQMACQGMKKVRALSEGEIKTRSTGAVAETSFPGMTRAWDYWKRRASFCSCRSSDH